jgi:hypothetical protein
MPGQLRANPGLNAPTFLFPPSELEEKTMKKNLTFAAMAGSALAALTVGLAAPAAAIPSGNGQDTVTAPAYPTTGQTAYGTYQNPHKSR